MKKLNRLSLRSLMENVDINEAKATDWSSYVSSEKDKAKKKEKETLSKIWQNTSENSRFDGKASFKNKENYLNFPGNYVQEFDGFVNWYKHVTKNKQAMQIANKKVGDDLHPKECVGLISFLIGMHLGEEEKKAVVDLAKSLYPGIGRVVLQQKDKGSTTTIAKEKEDKEEIKESLSRANLYRRRYHGRY